MDFELKKINARSTIAVRHQVLRIGKPVESCSFDGDLLPSTLHLGIFMDSQIIAVLSVFEKKTVLFTENIQYQIRGMAVLQQYQNQKLGQHLIQFAETELVSIHCDLIWFNARISAIGFYEKLGYKQIGNVFTIDSVGEHVLMFKKLCY